MRICNTLYKQYNIHTVYVILCTIHLIYIQYAISTLFPALTVCYKLRCDEKILIRSKDHQSYNNFKAKLLGALTSFEKGVQVVQPDHSRPSISQACTQMDPQKLLDHELNETN